jgi:acyl carrier protein
MAGSVAVRRGNQGPLLPGAVQEAAQGLHHGLWAPLPLASIPAYNAMNKLEQELAALIIGELNLEDVQLDAVTADTQLYGEGLGLDSIDILEIALLISKKYGFELRSDNPDNQKIFATLGALAAYVAAHRIR